MTLTTSISSLVAAQSYAPAAAYKAAAPGALSCTVQAVAKTDRLEAVFVNSKGIVQARFAAENSFRAAVVLHEVCEALAIGTAVLDASAGDLPAKWHVTRTVFLPQERQVYAAHDSATWQLLAVRSSRSVFNQWQQGFNLYTSEPGLIERVEAMLDEGLFFAQPIASAAPRLMPWLVDATALVASL